MRAVRRLFVLVAATLAALLGAATVVPADAGPPPSAMASLGDSITRGFNASGFFADWPALSWSTGSDSRVNSHYLRIRTKNSAISGRNYNDARTGAKITDLPGQTDIAVGQGVEYVTILMGANDACTSSESAMTSVAAYRAQLATALDKIKAGLPNARVLLVSIPDLKRLWSVLKDNPSARLAWSTLGICQSMLANPTSTAATDNARRDRVRQRVVDFNTELANACAAYGSNCKFDGNATFNYPFAASQVSTWDYFHPNVSGQQTLAKITYDAGFGW